MATTDYNQRQGIVALWREYTGLSETTDIADATVVIRINDHYVNIFAPEVDTDDYHQDYNIATAATDDGSYDLPANIVEVETAWLNGNPITLYRDLSAFYQDHPDNEEGYTTPPSLAIGTDTTKVAYGAFAYEINGYVYEIAAGEVVLSGDTIPDGKYGAFILSVDADKSVTVRDGDTNATGWDTIGAAINDLPAVGANEVVMGYVVVYTSGATFVPGTTGLDAAEVTDTYTDGDPAYRGQPEAVLVAGRDLIVRPKPDDIYRIKLPMVFYKPAELSADASEVFNELWGHAIAMGDAIAYCNRLGDDARAERLLGRPDKPGTYKWYMNKIKSTKAKQEQANVVYREF